MEGDSNSHSGVIARDRFSLSHIQPDAQHNLIFGELS
jgi:hypothetical protein